jgi:hypothetical protein
MEGVTAVNARLTQERKGKEKETLPFKIVFHLPTDDLILSHHEAIHLQRPEGLSLACADQPGCINLAGIKGDASL